jgi:hypothetical protein
MDDILDAMTISGDDPVRFFLDLETGKVESRFSPGVYGTTGEDEDDFDQRVEDDPQRYEEIPQYACWPTARDRTQGPLSPAWPCAGGCDGGLGTRSKRASRAHLVSSRIVRFPPTSFFPIDWFISPAYAMAKRVERTPRRMTAALAGDRQRFPPGLPTSPGARNPRRLRRRAK